jgi:glycerol-3-phosphate acyltransferase PlsY
VSFIVPILLLVVAYLYGSVPFGFLFAKVLRGVDIREVGSGNIGATNAARVLGFRYFPVVFVLDFTKGFLPALVASRVVETGADYAPHPLAVGAALAAILGHVFPVYLKFKGGKAVAAGTGACTILAPWALLIAAGAWAVMFGIFRYVSLASVTAAAALAISTWLVYPDPLGTGLYRTAFCTLAGLFVIVLHHSNIRRLIKGTEHKIGAGRGAEKSNEKDH